MQKNGGPDSHVPVLRGLQYRATTELYLNVHPPSYKYGLTSFKPPLAAWLYPTPGSRQLPCTDRHQAVLSEVSLQHLSRLFYTVRHDMGNRTVLDAFYSYSNRPYNLNAYKQGIKRQS